MGLLRSLFSRRSAPRHELPDTTDDALNALFVLLRNRVCDFKDVTKMDWTLILPAIQRISIRLFIQARGHESTQKLLAATVRKMEEEHGFRSKVGRNISLFPEMASEQLPQLAKLNALLWQIADETVATGRPLEHVAQGFSKFVALVASRKVDLLGESYGLELVHASYREFQSGAFDDGRAIAS
jgi:hypothetical protein